MSTGSMILPDLSGITARIHWETCITFLPHCSHGSSLFSLFSSCLVVLMRSDSIKYQLFPDSIYEFSGLCGQFPDFAEISGSNPGLTINFAPAAAAASTCSFVSTVPAPTSICGKASVIRRMDSSAAAVRKVTSALKSPP